MSLPSILKVSTLLIYTWQKPELQELLTAWLSLSAALSMLWKETKALFRCRCRASLIGCAALLLYSQPLINQCWQGRGFVCHIAGQMSARERGTPERRNATHTTQPLACRLAPARFDGLACRKIAWLLIWKCFRESQSDVFPRDVCAAVVIIYLAFAFTHLPPPHPPHLSPFYRGVQRKDEDMGRRQSVPGLSPWEAHSGALHEILFIIILTGLNVWW